MQKLRAEKGITLIALVITIIVMLILVGVSVTVALNGGLFSTAQKATGDTKTERDNELALSDGKVTINGEEYNSIDEYVNSGENGTGEQKVTITPKKETYTVGEEVAIGTENFYVIADDADKVTLLAKDCIDTTNLVQSASAGTVAFSETNYWSSVEGITYPHDLIETGEPDASHKAVRAAYDYGTKLGGIGRLMTKAEAEALNTETYSDILYGTNGKSSATFLVYWLGTAYNGEEVWKVWMAAMGPTLNYSVYSDNSGGGSRPVVEISKSSIS